MAFSKTSGIFRRKHYPHFIYMILNQIFLKYSLQIFVAFKGFSNVSLKQFSNLLLVDFNFSSSR